MGRPKLPKGEQKSTQIGVRFNASQDQEIDGKVSESGRSKAEWVRDAALDEVDRQQWVKSKWKIGELEGKRVEFRIAAAEGGSFVGVGKFLVSENPEGLLRIEVVCDIATGPYSWAQHRLPLNQYVANKIAPHPDQKAAHFIIQAQA